MNMRYRRRAATLPVLATLALTGAMITTSALATEDAVPTLAEVVVTATRNPQQVEKIPATVTVITAEEIAKTNAATVPDVLRLLPGVQVRDLTGSGNEQAVDIGGFGESADRHVAVVVNGRRINAVDMSYISWATIPVENIERIEVLYGSGAVLYGDNAMGGVINIITKEATSEGVHGKAELSYGSFDTVRGSADLDVVSGRTSFHAGYGHQETDGYRDRSKAGPRHPLCQGGLRSDRPDFAVSGEHLQPGRLPAARRPDQCPVGGRSEAGRESEG